MDNEKLILTVFSHHNLWDTSSKNYHNRDISRQTWKKISKEMGLNVEAVKTRWRGLRDTFRRELKKIPKRRSSDEGGTPVRSSWPHFSSMLFLKDQFTPRKFSDNILEVELNENPWQTTHTEESEDRSENLLASDATEYDIKECEIEVSQSRKRRAHNAEMSVKKRQKSEKYNSYEKLLDTEQKQFIELKSACQSNPQNHIDDADYHFLLSLLPYLRKVQEDRKLIVRTRLQQVFCDEEDYQRRSLKFCENPASGTSSNDLTLQY
ncbi:uncharacterized protein LOC117221943 [Megalopta genalis]|uniref:uncharacterized protein LOC117221943 n=1 Tax=Megalopta genalis TaxID=115081 RepID=UPI0014433781|nr:uncharacterized protein LOC117221943 [Megalopta genalis]